MTLHRVIDSPFRDGGGNKPIWGTPLDMSHPWARQLVRYWHFSEGQGGRVADLVHGSNSGALNATNTTWTGGPSLTFNGTTGFADSLSDRGIPALLPQVGQTQTANDASSISMMCWFKPNGASQSAHLISRWDDAVASNGGKVWSLLLGDATGTAAGNRIWFGIQTSDALGSVARTISTNGFTNLAWNYASVAFTNTMTTSQMNVVVNGVVSGFVGNIWFANANTATPGVVLGADHNGGVHGGFYSGQILAAAIWHRWLDKDEQIGLYNRPWEIFLPSNVVRFFRTTTPVKGVPIVPRLSQPADVNSDRAVTFSEKVSAIINSLLRQGQLFQSGINDWSINAAAIQATAGVTSFNTRKGDVTLLPSDLPIFSSAAPGAVPASGGGTVNFIRADGTWVTAVQSVALTMPAEFSVGGSPVTGSGTFAVTKANETANTVWAGPTTGGAAAPTFRALVAADLTGLVASSVSNSDGTLTISPTTGAVVASLALGHANTWTANVTIDGTHHLLLSEMTPGSVLFAGTSGQVSQNNANFFWDNANKRLGIWTAAPGTAIDAEVTTTSGAAFTFNSTQTQPNTSDLGDSCMNVGFTVSASSATNELVARAFTFTMTNALTGGGHVQNLRGLTIILNTNSGTTTDSADLILLQSGFTGTVTQVNCFHCTGMTGATTQAMFVADAAVATTSIAFLEGAAPGSGQWGVYITDNLPSVFGGWIRQNQGRARVLSDQNNATSTFANLADLTLNLTAGRSYFGRVAIRCVNTVPADGIKFDFNGGSATMTNFWAGTANQFVTTLAGVLSNASLASERILLFDISLTVNAGGTLIFRFASNTPTTGTATVRLGSFITLEDSSN